MREKRKLPRLPFTATVNVVHSRGRSFFACARDINRGGIGLYSCSMLNDGMEVKLEIMFKDLMGKDSMETICGMVEWQYKWNWVNVLGVKFDKLLNYEETPSLMEYIENREKLLEDEFPIA